jgi:hypoxanthine phosphoribosyltransferase
MERFFNQNIGAVRGMLKLIIPPEEIRKIVERLAGEIRHDCSKKNPVLVGVLKGSFVFMADLVRALEMPVEVDFIRAIRYGIRDRPSKEARIIKDIETNIEGRDVIVVEDIIDGGVTMKALVEHLKAKRPASIKLCALLLRSTIRAEVKIDYLGTTVSEGFVVGYGLDLKEQYRHLPALYVIEDKKGG